MAQVLAGPQDLLHLGIQGGPSLTLSTFFIGVFRARSAALADSSSLRGRESLAWVLLQKLLRQTVPNARYPGSFRKKSSHREAWQV